MTQLLSILLFVFTTNSALVAPGSTPRETVQEFKAALDRNDMYAVCQVMADEEGNGPLKSIHYEQMARSLEGLGSMWRGVPFTYQDTEIDDNSGQARAVIKVEAKNLSQEVRFVLLKFGRAWYIFDIEIYFRS